MCNLANVLMNVLESFFCDSHAQYPDTGVIVMRIQEWYPHLDISTLAAQVENRLHSLLDYGILCPEKSKSGYWYPGPRWHSTPADQLEEE